MQNSLMNEKRLKIQKLFEDMLGNKNVYYQPPSSLRIKYPCIIYKWDSSETTYADNLKYQKAKGYEVMYIDKNPDSDVPDKIENLQFCRYQRHYVSNGLNHYVFKLFC